MEVRIKFAFGLERNELYSSPEFLKDIYSNLSVITQRYCDVIQQKTWTQRQWNKEHEVKGTNYVIKYVFHDVRVDTPRVHAVVEVPVAATRETTTDTVVAMVTENETVAMETDEPPVETKPRRDTRRLATKRRRHLLPEPVGVVNQPEPVAPPGVNQPHKVSVSDRRHDSTLAVNDDDIFDQPMRKEKREPRDARHTRDVRDARHTRDVRDARDLLSPVCISTTSDKTETPEVHPSLGSMESTSAGLDLHLVTPPSPHVVTPPSPTINDYSLNMFESPSDPRMEPGSPFVPSLSFRKVLKKDANKSSSLVGLVPEPVDEIEQILDSKLEKSVINSTKTRPAGLKKRNKMATTSCDVTETRSVCPLVSESGTIPKEKPSVAEDVLPTIKHTRQRSRVAKCNKKGVYDFDSDHEEKNCNKKTGNNKKTTRKRAPTEKKAKTKANEGKRSKSRKKPDVSNGDTTIDRWLSNVSPARNGVNTATKSTQMHEPDWSPPKSPGMAGNLVNWSPSHSLMEDYDEAFSPVLAASPTTECPDRTSSPVTEKAGDGRKLPELSGNRRGVPTFSESDSGDGLPTIERKSRNRLRTPVKSPIIQRKRNNVKQAVGPGCSKWNNISNVHQLASGLMESSHSRPDPLYRQHYELEHSNSSQELPDLSKSNLVEDDLPHFTHLSTTRNNARKPTVASSWGIQDGASEGELSNEMRNVYHKEREKLSSPLKSAERLDAAPQVKSEAGYRVKREPDDWNRSVKRRVSVLDMKRRLSVFSPDVTTSGTPEVIEIAEDEDDVGDLDPEELDRQIEMVTDVKYLNEQQLNHLVQRNKFYLRDIIDEKVHCERLVSYKKGGRARVNLTGDVYLQRYREEQDDVILNSVMDIFSRGTLKYSEYVFKVLFPEVLIRIFMQVHRIDDYEEAVEEMNNVDFDVDAPLGLG